MVQRKIDELFNDIPNMFDIADDILTICSVVGRAVAWQPNIYKIV